MCCVLQVMHMSFFPQDGNVPMATVWLWFAFLSLKSRTFAVMQTRDQFGCGTCRTVITDDT